MHHKTIGFIGGGRVTRIFLEGWTRAQKLPASITVSDPNAELLAKLRARFPSIATVADNAVTAAKDIVFLAVHPASHGRRGGAMQVESGRWEHRGVIRAKVHLCEADRPARWLCAAGAGDSECAVRGRRRFQSGGVCACAVRQRQGRNHRPAVIVRANARKCRKRSWKPTRFFPRWGPPTSGSNFRPCGK